MTQKRGHQPLATNKTVDMLESEDPDIAKNAGTGQAQSR